jgi:hypothetical protein
MTARVCCARNAPCLAPVSLCHTSEAAVAPHSTAVTQGGCCCRRLARCVRAAHGQAGTAARAASCGLQRTRRVKEAICSPCCGAADRARHPLRAVISGPCRCDTKPYNPGCRHVRQPGHHAAVLLRVLHGRHAAGDQPPGRAVSVVAAHGCRLVTGRQHPVEVGGTHCATHVLSMLWESPFMLADAGRCWQLMLAT